MSSTYHEKIKNHLGVEASKEDMVKIIDYIHNEVMDRCTTLSEAVQEVSNESAMIDDY